MRRLFTSAAVVLVLIAWTGAATPAIKPADLLDHIKYLASDELKGRASGSEGLEAAGNYIAKQFAAAGLRPGGNDNGWFQPFDVVAGLDVGPGNTLVLADGRHTARLTLSGSYFPLSAPSNDSAGIPSADLKDVPLVFAGYGISAPSLMYDDYAGLDVQDKAVIIFSHEPQERDRDSRLNGAQPIEASTLYSKASAARTHGARALIVVSDPTHQLDQANYKIFEIVPDAEDLGIPVLRARRDQLGPLIFTWGLDKLAAQIDRDLVPRSRLLPGATVTYREFLSKKRRMIRNVIGILPGADPAHDQEAIVIGAHYDHVGLGGRLSASPDRTGEVHNGADDNASGTASVIEIARAAAADRSRFPRTLVFIAFAGEERGLLGSRYYASNPVVPLAKTVAMLNLDMVGRSRGWVDVSGLDVAPSLLPDLEAAEKAAGGLEVKQEGPGAGRSDDSSFLDRRIPAVNFFTGFHGDYHRPSDDWQKIDAEKTARVAMLALEFAARIAERSDRPELVESGQR